MASVWSISPTETPHDVGVDAPPVDHVEVVVLLLRGVRVDRDAGDVVGDLRRVGLVEDALELVREGCQFERVGVEGAGLHLGGDHSDAPPTRFAFSSSWVHA